MIGLFVFCEGVLRPGWLLYQKGVVNPNGPSAFCQSTLFVITASNVRLDLPASFETN